MTAIKTEADHFVDWEGHVFGFGYGTGEPHTLHVLKAFFANVPSAGAYDYEVLEQRLDAEVAWLLINALCRADIIEYGSSPRYGWLTDQGKALKAFVDARTHEELVKLVCDQGEDYVHCYPDCCNCGPEGYRAGRACGNPFWKRQR